MPSKTEFVPFVLWLTGLSGSGKSSLSVMLKRDLIKKKLHKVKIIDGDSFRKKYPKYGYNLIDREKIGYIKVREAIKFYKRGYICIVSGIAHKKIWREKIRKKFKKVNYSEIYLKCTLKKCISRKNFIYRNKIKNVVGISGKNYEYEESKKYELLINTAKNKKLKCLSILNKYLKKRYGK